jgi:hypothetical protein
MKANEIDTPHTHRILVEADRSGLRLRIESPPPT